MAHDRNVNGMSSAFTLITLCATFGMTAYNWDWTGVGPLSPTRATVAQAEAQDKKLAVQSESFVTGATAPPAPRPSFADVIEAQVAEAPPAPSSAKAPVAASALCGDPRLSGVALGPMKEPLKDGSGRMCGGDDIIRLDRVAGVTITPTAITSCRLARSFADWIQDGVNPAAQTTLGASVVRVRQVSDYVCRTRNRKKGGKLSEHGRANAIDIADFTLSSGAKVVVLDDWRVGATAGRKALFLQQVWRAGCGPFTTVLGPLADKYHQDHFHMDTAVRKRPYCR